MRKTLDPEEIACGIKANFIRFFEQGFTGRTAADAYEGNEAAIRFHLANAIVGGVTNVKGAVASATDTAGIAQLRGCGGAFIAVETFRAGSGNGGNGWLFGRHEHESKA